MRDHYNPFSRPHLPHSPSHNSTPRSHSSNRPLTTLSPSNQSTPRSSSSQFHRPHYYPRLMKPERLESEFATLNDASYQHEGATSSTSGASRTFASSSNSSEPHPSLVKKNLTTNGMWSPLGFSASQLYDYTNGVPLDRATCESNLEKLRRNHRPVDYSEYLTLAQQCRSEGQHLLEQVCIGIAFQTANANEIASKLYSESKKNEKLSGLIPKRGFSLDAAQEFDVDLELPSRKVFRMSDIIDSTLASNWTSTDFEAHARALLRAVFDKVESADPLFPCFGSSSSASIYCPINRDVIKSISDYIVSGFGQEGKKDTQTFVQALVLSVLENKLNRSRAQYCKKYGKDAARNAAAWLQKELEDPEGELKRERLDFEAATLSNPTENEAELQPDENEQLQ